MEGQERRRRVHHGDGHEKNPRSRHSNRRAIHLEREPNHFQVGFLRFFTLFPIVKQS